MASFIFKIHGEAGNCPYPNLANGCRDSPIETEDEEATRPKKPICVNMKGSSLSCSTHTLSNLPNELLVQIMFNISDRRTLLHVSLLSKQFQRLFDSKRWPLVLSAYTREGRQGQHTLDIDTICNTITSRINEHPISTSKLIESYWKGLCTARRWKDAVDFLVKLDQELYNKHYDVVEPLRTICQRALVDRSWDAWAAAFTAADFLQDEFGIMMRQLVRDRVAVGWRDIVGQSVFTCQWKDVYFVSEQLQIYLRRNSDELAEVVKATLDLAVQEHEWQDALCQASKLIRLTANTRPVVHILEIICNHAILEGQWGEVNRAVSVLGTVGDNSNVDEEFMSTLQNMWDHIAPQAFHNQWQVALNLAKHLAKQLKIRNRNSEVVHILQTLWDEAARKHDWDSATTATKEIVPLQGKQTIPMLKKAWHEEYSKCRWEDAFAVAWKIVENDSDGAVQMLKTMWDIAIKIGSWSEAFSIAIHLQRVQPTMSHNEVVVMLQAMWDSAVHHQGLVSYEELADLGGELKNMISHFDSEWEQSMWKQRWGEAFAKGYHIAKASWRMKTGTCNDLLLWMIQHHVGQEREMKRWSYLCDLSAKWGLVKFGKLPLAE
ncbi:hypothetical protein VE02_05634 [Pseudogymnoascus sp. 03VT05]|nr:hypothetical protein VE02_05634 [Pseudogymnoascus sp. 03VT05]